MCGKNLHSRHIVPCAPGSPPRVREEPCLSRGRLRLHGITPACAGRTKFFSGFPSLYEDHPRVCGKNRPCPRPCRRLRGSPPRVREELLRCAYRIAVFGITPACAGRTFMISIRPAPSRDHPRVCGKNSSSSSIISQSLGSPPRVREEPIFLLTSSNRWGITPACAGRTQNGKLALSRFGDHPRVCGKN